MKHFWPLTIVAVLFAFTAQAGQVNNKPTLSAAQTVKPPTTTSSKDTQKGGDKGSHPSENLSLSFGKVEFEYKEQAPRTDPQSGLPTGKRMHSPITGAARP